MHADRIPDQLTKIELGTCDEIAERLFAVLGQGIRALLSRHIHESTDLDRAVDECIRAIASAIHAGAVREPGAIISYAVRVARQQGAALSVRQQSQESSCRPEQSDLFGRALLRLSRSDRALLRRFYFQRESDQEISEALGLTEIQIRQRIAHAKRKLTKEINQLERRRGTFRFLEWLVDRTQGVVR
jgi:RNA polymerase sigma factor (sigma-70 family)